MKKKLQNGTIIAITKVANPPAGFSKKPRNIALIELEDKTKVIGCITNENGLEIGKAVCPRMHLHKINSKGLRIYDVAYEPTVLVEEKIQIIPKFPGYIIALSGPSGVGKSTVSKLLATAMSEYTEQVPIYTTRNRKTGDDGEYKYISSKKFHEMKKEKKIISTTSIPSESEKREYGYKEEDILKIWSQGKIPIVITEQHLLQGLADHFGRRSILSFGLLPPGKGKRVMLSQLLHRLRKRGRDTEKSIEDRMKNAELDLAFFDEKKELFDHILVNEKLELVIESLQMKVSHVYSR
ncbi:MAG: hypothetical protein KAS32_18645 [Candidatus Peribacteraceae bacterium]|nr:hypothetical protein [Candidatus Peribacteraceae bacterium]